MRHTSLILLMTLAASAAAQTPRRPVHTYSVVAVDSVTGEIGAAVQSHWFNVGSIVTWAEPGVGAVATQSFVDPSYGPRGLYLMRTGTSGPAALHALLRADPDSAVRQVAMIDARGRVQAYTGSRDIPAAGHHTGRWYSVQANLMKNDRVWPAMAHAFETTTGDLADHMLAALKAAQGVGGDIRGSQSAAMIVVSGDRTRPPWERIIDIRVEDNPNPLGELERLLRVARAYRAATDGDNFVTAGQVDSALASYQHAGSLLTDEQTNGELAFWQAVTMLDLGRKDGAVPLFRRAFAQDSNWIELLWRLPSVGLLSADSTTIAATVKEAGRRP
jgi:uncharacterized Ntn-hydrolase superfamily protein